MGRSVVSTIVAVMFVAGLARADGEWRPSGDPPPAAPPVAPADPAPPPAVPKADTPPWLPTRPESPKWVPVARGASALPDALPEVQAPVAPVPKPEAVPAPQPVTPKADAPPARLPEPRPNPLAAPPAAIWGSPPAACPPVLEPVPAGVAGGTVSYRNKTFGSPNLTLSRDYHFLDLFGVSLLGGEDANTVVLDEAPATDRYFVQTEYLLWWVRRSNIPILATTAPDPANPNDPNANFGFLGQPGTNVLFGPGGFGSTARNGFRVRAGTWLDNGYGLDGSFFFLGERTNRFELASPLFPVITRPFFAPNVDPRTGQVIGEFGEVVAGGGTQGRLLVEQDSRLWGADLNFRSCIHRTCVARSEWFVGYRHLNLREGLRISESLVSGPNDAPQPAGTHIFVQDEFRTHNRFHGGQVGYAVGRRWGRIDADARVSVALGVTAQDLDITGSQLVQRPGQATPTAFTGGLLAVGPNLGSFSNDEFSVVPEVTFNVGYLLTPTLRAYVGYNFLYWTNVARPGDQLDRVVDLSFIPNAPVTPFSGVNRPQPLFRQTDFWAQGLQLGLELRW
ncbi:MAG TPA: BBP7 family outer membrane beta-barrel protein [Fimbriiglobus sp.]|nr:BBP7 family outer membrane beta-barrel protein [Fimbriiglobus sp.]